MVGQYPFAAIVGKVIDKYGPWACSLVASFLFSTGFGVFAAEISKTPDEIAAPSESSFRILSACFFLVGLATVSSYVSQHNQRLLLSSPQKAISRLSFQPLECSLNTWVPHRGQVRHFLACLRFSSVSWHPDTLPTRPRGSMSRIS
jgi:hypothetical protein